MLGVNRVQLSNLETDMKEKKKGFNNVWLLGFEPRSPRPQRGILTTKLQPHPVIHLRNSLVSSELILLLQMSNSRNQCNYNIFKII